MFEMNERKNKVISTIVLPVILLLVVLSAVFVIIPGNMGFIAVLKKIAMFSFLEILGASLIFLFVKSRGNNNFKRTSRTVCAVMGVLCIVVGTVNIYLVTRGLLAGVQTVDIENYELYSPISTKGIKEYYIKTMINDKLTKISIDHFTYEELQLYSGSLTVTYYPYVNVADKIIQK